MLSLRRAALRKSLLLPIFANKITITTILLQHELFLTYDPPVVLHGMPVRILSMFVIRFVGFR